jgi:hypothetical protein
LIIKTHITFTLTLFLSLLSKPEQEEFINMHTHSILIINTQQECRTKMPSEQEQIKRQMQTPSKLEFFEEIVDVFVDLISPFLMDEVPCPFNYYHILQKWHISLHPTFVNVISCARCIIGKVKITHYKLHWNFDLSTSPWSIELPVSTNAREAIW